MATGERQRSNPLHVFLDLTKFRISAAVTITTLAGYVLESGHLRWDAWIPVLGAFLLAAGSSALNQWQEAAFDARMPRTVRRPIPAGRVRPATAFFVAGLLILAGLYTLASAPLNSTTVAGLGLLSVVWYNGIYTYLKRVIAFAVVPGAVIGALPPLIG